MLCAGDGTAGLRAEQGDSWVDGQLQGGNSNSNIPSSKVLKLQESKVDVYIYNLYIYIYYVCIYSAQYNDNADIEMVIDPCVIPVKINIQSF